jgi:hypothetical protein
MDTARGVACLLVAVICLSCAAAAAARSPAARLHRHLKRLNKPAVKSIEVRQPHLFPLAFRPAEVCVCSMPAVLLLLLVDLNSLLGKKKWFFFRRLSTDKLTPC